MKGAGSAGRGALTNVPAGRIASAAQARKLRRRHARGHLRSGKAAKASKARVRGLSMAVQTAHADGLSSPTQDALCSAPPGKMAPFPRARSALPVMPQRRPGARVRCAARSAGRPHRFTPLSSGGVKLSSKDRPRAPLPPLLLLRPAGVATRGSGKNGFSLPFPPNGGEREICPVTISGGSPALLDSLLRLSADK